jgi:hypothetical protein
MTNDQSSSWSFLTALRLMARRALVAAYSCGKGSRSSRDCDSATGFNRLVHLKNAEPPLHEGDDPPVVDVGKD